jgi:hypothetical protein
MSSRHFSRAALALAVSALPLAAQQRQAPTFSIEGGANYQALRGTLYSDLSDGRGSEAQATLGISNLAVSAGYQRSYHNVIGTANRQATLSGFYVEPRLALPLAASNFTPYLYGRGGLLERSETVGTGAVKSTASQLGGGLGSLIYLAKGVQLNLAGGYQYMRAGRRIADDTRTNGGAFMLRAGLTLGSSGWARDPGF